ncbi:TPA: TetR/AcrR family transcriptional regulator [Enterobacter hormaechei subsp. steigerwaltii]|nr:TetR/AcrR family transcriptional regulator [Enterobacter hormaechei subsp. steigerwaltii]
MTVSVVYDSAESGEITVSTYGRLLDLDDNFIQENGYQGFSYADLAVDFRIRKASINQHFPAKMDLGIAYCERKEAGFLQLEALLLTLTPGRERLRGYMNTFLRCADRGLMCGVHAMLSDRNLFEPALQDAVNSLAQTDLRILTAVLESGRESGELVFSAPSADVAIIIGSAIKRALMLNRIPPHDACTRTLTALEQLLCR